MYFSALSAVSAVQLHFAATRNGSLERQQANRRVWRAIRAPLFEPAGADGGKTATDTNLELID
jgi:hypothetical protein